MTRARKNELVQLHLLLIQVRFVAERLGLPAVDAFAPYDACRTRPTSIHHSKTQHQRAVFLLGQGIATLLGSSVQHGLTDRFAELAKHVQHETHPAPEAKT